MAPLRHQSSRSRALSGKSGPATAEDGFPPLTKAQLTELRRRMAEADDPHRYLIVSAFSRRFVLYYDVQADAYVMNRPADATAFKKRSVAEAALAALQEPSRTKDANLQIIAARKTRHGLRLLEQPVYFLDRIRARGHPIGNRKSRI